MKPTNQLFSSLPTTIFTVMSKLAVEHKAINLGQGFPAVDGPHWLREKAAQYLVKGPNQYPPMMGVPELRQAVAEHNKRFYELDVDWEQEVLVTSGATEALGDCFLGLLNVGDEAIVIEPFYDSYAPMIREAGATPVFVQLQPPHWELDRDALRAAFSDKTKLLVLNSPMNPTGKVFSDSDLSFIASLLVEFDAYAVCDEVYEHLLFDSAKHRPLMTFEGMRDRCARIGSAGKTFSVTGWKVGYVTAAPHLMEAIAKTHQFLTFTTVPALQYAVADGLRTADDYFQELASEQQAMRDQLSKGLTDIGFDVCKSAGTYFVTCDFAPLGFKGDDMAFCQDITKNAQVAAVPVSAFYGNADGNVPNSLVRFCFCKTPQELSEALDRLRRYFN